MQLKKVNSSQISIIVFKFLIIYYFFLKKKFVINYTMNNKVLFTICKKKILIYLILNELIF